MLLLVFRRLGNRLASSGEIFSEITLGPTALTSERESLRSFSTSETENDTRLFVVLLLDLEVACGDGLLNLELGR